MQLFVSTAATFARFAVLAGAGLLCSWKPIQTFGQPPKDPPVPVERPNVLLIVLDDVGIETLDFYDYNSAALNCIGWTGGPPPSSMTPNLDLLAAESVVFRRAYAYALCSPTRASILTGRHAFRTGMGSLASAPTTGPYTLPLSERTIPEMLKGGFPASWPKYRCGAFGKWDVTAGATASFFIHPIDQGFDRFVGTMGNDPSHFSWTKVDAQANPHGSSSSPETRYSATVVREEAEGWIQSVSEPFFAYVCFNPPHAPYEVPPLETLSLASRNQVLAHLYQPGDDLTGTADQRLAYDWMLESVDQEVGNLINGLGAKRSRTTILIVSDNGTPQGLLLPPYEDDHGKGSAYEQGVRVPFLATGQRVMGAGFHEGVVSLVDLWRTVASITDANPGAGGEDSVDLETLFQNPLATLARPSVLVQRFRNNGLYSQSSLPDFNVRAMVSTEFKYIRSTSANGLFLQQAYRLTQDPNLTPADPTECQNLLDVWGSLSPTDQSRITALSDAMTLLSGAR